LTQRQRWETIKTKKNVAVSETDADSHCASSSLLTRSVCQVFTPGTLVHPDMLSNRPEPQYTMSILFSRRQQSDLVSSFENNKTKNSNCRMSVCVVDCAASEFQMAEVDEDSIRAIQNLIAQLQPKEILFCPDTTPSKVVHITLQFICRFLNCLNVFQPSSVDVVTHLSHGKIGSRDQKMIK
jgi:DNA mismatch repair ATPase MutS